MSSFVYILRNDSTCRNYVGSTNDLQRRIHEHKAGKTRTTKILKTFTLVYKEEFGTIYEARLREKEIKSYKSRKYIEWLINNGSVAQR